MKLELSKSFEVQNQEIDQDHTQLIGIINAIVKLLDDGEPEACVPLVSEFVDFAKQHFTREEAFLKDVGYPQANDVSDHHRGLHHKMDTMLELAASVIGNKPAQDSLRRELIYFMMDDVINEDLDFKSFLIEKGHIAKK